MFENHFAQYDLHSVEDIDGNSLENFIAKMENGDNAHERKAGGIWRTHAENSERDENSMSMRELQRAALDANEGKAVSPTGVNCHAH